MEILLDNLSWMVFNIFLAFLGVFLGILFLQAKTLLFKGIFFLLWLLFVPNTIYLITDFKWFFEQYSKVEFPAQILLLVQYIVVFILGIVTFVLGLSFWEKFLYKNRVRNINLMLFLSNYLIAFGVILGRVERSNSWDVFIQPQTVLLSSLNIIQSEKNLIFVFLFGTLANLIYFGWKKFTLKIVL